MRIPGWLCLTLALVAAACGGSTTNNQQPDPASLIQKACNNVAALNCSAAPTMQTCTSNLDQASAQAKTQGCTSQFDGVMVCYADKLTSCSQDSQVVCSTQLDALNACETKGGSSQCSQGTSGAPPGAPAYYQKCNIGCGTWSAQCETKTSPTLDCSCTSGPKSGTTFIVASCNDMPSVGAGHCQ